MSNEIKSSIILPMILVCLGHFLVDVMIGIWPVYKTLAHVDLALAGLVGAVCAFAGEGLQIFFGSLSDKGYRKALILCGILAASGSAFFVYTDHILCLFGLYLLTCTGSGAFHPCAASLVSELSTKHKGLFISIFSSCGAFGMAFSQILFTSSHKWFDGHASLLAIPAVLLVACAFFSKAGQSKPEANGTSKHFDLKIIGSFFKTPSLRNLYFTQLCTASMLWGTMFLLPDMLSSREYAPWISFGGGHMMFILGCAFMMIPAGSLADRYSERNVIFSALLIGMSIFYTLLFMPTLSNIALLSLLFCLGAAIGVVQPVAISLGTSLAPAHKGMISAFLMGMVWCISEGIGQFGGGVLATYFTDDAPAKALAVLGGIFLIGSVFAYKLPTTQEITVMVNSE